MQSCSTWREADCVRYTVESKEPHSADHSIDPLWPSDVLLNCCFENTERKLHDVVELHIADEKNVVASFTRNDIFLEQSNINLPSQSIL